MEGLRRRRDRSRTVCRMLLPRTGFRASLPENLELPPSVIKTVSFLLCLTFCCVTATSQQPVAGATDKAPAAQAGEAATGTRNTDLEDAKQADEARQGAALAVRQAHVRQLLVQMQTRFQLLARSLAETEPQQAARLSAALDQSRERLLEQQMQQAAMFLDAGRWDDASDLQQQVVSQLETLARLLVEEEPDPAALLAEQQRLEAWRDQLARLRHDEQLQRRESQRLIDKPATLARLQQQADQARQFASSQQQLAEETAAASARGIEGLPRLAASQRQLREQVAEFSQSLTPAAQPAAMSPPEDAARMPKPEEESPLLPLPPEPGEEPLRQALERQQAAEDQLRESRGQGAHQEQQQAAASLQAAERQWSREQERLAALPADVATELARRQQATRKLTVALAEQIEALILAADGQPAPPEQQSADPASLTRANVLEAVSQAADAMQQAQQPLAAGQFAPASQRQQQAVAALQRAERQVQDRLTQLQNESPADKAARLADYFRELLARQQQATAKTVELAEPLTAGKSLGRGERLALKKLAEEERALAAGARESQVSIITEGSSVVLPRIVGQLADDLQSVAGRLDESQLDRYTQTLQREIEQTLEQLIDTLDKSAEQAGKQPSPERQTPPDADDNEAPPPEPPLLPGLAELKLLRAAQQRINRRTAAVASLRGEGPLDDSQAAELQRLAELQTITAAMAEELIIRYAISGGQ